MGLCQLTGMLPSGGGDPLVAQVQRPCDHTCGASYLKKEKHGADLTGCQQDPCGTTESFLVTF